jgi:hypothetical protein
MRKWNAYRDINEIRPWKHPGESCVMVSDDRDLPGHTIRIASLCRSVSFHVQFTAGARTLAWALARSARSLELFVHGWGWGGLRGTSHRYSRDMSGLNNPSGIRTGVRLGAVSALWWWHASGSDTPQRGFENEQQVYLHGGAVAGIACASQRPETIYEECARVTASHLPKSKVKLQSACASEKCSGWYISEHTVVLHGAFSQFWDT